MENHSDMVWLYRPVNVYLVCLFVFWCDGNIQIQIISVRL
jgi:hypothetical protein